MYSLPKNVYRERIDFSKIKTTVPIPNLIEIQKKSYESFLQMNRLPAKREDAGLQSVFKSVFPISDFRENSSLEFIEYSIGNWECKCGKLAGLHHLRKPCSNCGATLVADPYGDREVLCPRCGKGNQARGDVCDICGNTVGLKLKYDVDECQERGMTYAVPLKVTIRLVVWNKDPETGVKTIRDIKEQEVYFGDIPLMTENGTFIINGTERVIVSQLHRSPGAFFHSEDKTVYVAQIIPYRGSWVEFEYDTKNLLYVRIDRKRKFLASLFLRALGLRGGDEIIRTFYQVDRINLRDNSLYWSVGEGLVGQRSRKDVTAGEVSISEGKKITKSHIEGLRKAGVKDIAITDEAIEGAFAAADIVDPATGEVLLEANEELSQRTLSLAHEKGVDKVDVFFPEKDEVGPIMSATLKKDPIRTHEESLIEIYRRLRPGDPPTLDSSRSLFENMFFNPQKYDFSRVGRLKLNTKLGLSTPLDEKILHPQDFYEVIGYLLKLRRNPANWDDSDPVGNRRVRSVGELLENQFRIGLVRMERAIKEKMSVYQEMATARPHDLINAKPVMAAIREFFGSSQLSQFMDQTNPLSEITHKRRLSALGPGGLSRERAGFEVRDVHPTHYGRICPIETPEGPNIGLISSLSAFARINEFGFIETAYRKVSDGRVTDQIEYLTADREENFLVAQANAPIDGRGHFTGEKVSVRYRGDFLEVDPAKVNYMDVSPKQLVSVAAGLLPFLEHDDANRALMGSNMQRQGVPLVVSEAPLVGTGLEEKVARDSHAVVLATESGKVASVTADQIIVTKDGHLPESKKKVKTDSEAGIHVYELRKFMRSNAGTCVNQKPIVRKGRHVNRGQVIADGPNTDHGELALGRNVLVAFMPWNGYNFEDAIMISEKVVKEDVYTSIHIDEFEIGARDTKLGPEEITRDIPNVSEEALRNLGPAGVVRVGAEVKPGDILVGKITPKSETELAPEERLLRAIFGEKAADVKDTSLTVPSGTYGIIMDVKVSSRIDNEEEKLSPSDRRRQAKQIQEEHKRKKDGLIEQLTDSLSNVLLGEKVPMDVVNAKNGEIIIPANRKITKTLLRKLATTHDHIEIDPSPIRNKIREIIGAYEQKFAELELEKDRATDRVESGEEIEPGIIKQVKVYIASKRKLSVGDKMAGRHGNKAVVARIVPEEDMPFLADGTPVDIVLNPLGVPSRMNVGQVLETHLGVAAKALGFKVATPVFDGIKEKQIRDYMKEARKVEGYTWVTDTGKAKLFDGRTGDPFDQEVVVGYIYMMKLGHLVADKIHARAVGPYSLVTQQPLGGKAQYGGQRFGEMEVWALEAYGAAYTLQELLTVKSDDVQGRTRIYESIVKGDNSLEAGTPESFNVLIKEMQSLGLDVKVGSQAPTFMESVA